MNARAFASLTAVALAIVAAACGGSESSGSGGNALSAAATAGDGVGSTLGGCPENEQGDGAACTIKGRLCEWKRSSGALATGWCTAKGSWRVVVGPASPCPEKATTYQPAQGGAPSNGTPEPEPEPVCQAPLSCTYPSTPLDGSRTCSCQSSGQWNSLCEGNDDGWKPAAGASGSDCGELAACGGRSGCGTTCSGTVSPGPNGTTNVPAGQTTKSCGCGEDGLMYCTISSCGG